MELRPGSSGGGAASNPNALAVGVPTMGRDMPLINTVPMTNGTARLSYFTASVDLSGTLSCRTWCGSTAAVAAGGGTGIALYKEEANLSLTMLAGSTNVSLWNAPNTSFDLALAGAAFTAGQRYALAIMVTATTTAPTIGGSNQQFAQEMAEAPRMTGQVPSLALLPPTIAVASIANSPYRIYGVFHP